MVDPKPVHEAPLLSDPSRWVTSYSSYMDIANTIMGHVRDCADKKEGAPTYYNTFRTEELDGLLLQARRASDDPMKLLLILDKVYLAALGNEFDKDTPWHEGPHSDKALSEKVRTSISDAYAEVSGRLEALAQP